MELWVNFLFAFLIIFLLCLSAFYSFSEMAVASANPLRFKAKSKNEISKKKKNKTEDVLNLIEEYNETVTAIVILNNIVNILASTLATTWLTILFPSGTAFLFSFLLMTTATIIFGELLPKMLARKYPESGLMKFRLPLKITVYSLKPITLLSNKFIKQNEDESILKSESELRYAIKEIANAKHITFTEQKILENALDLDEKKISHTYIPKKKVISVNKNISQDELRQLIKRHSYTRMPILDDKKVIGILNVKNFIIDSLEDKPKNLDKYIYEFDSFQKWNVLSEAFESLRKKRQHMGIIIDAKNTFLGIITIEDILETVLGKMYDETDILENGIYEIDEHSYILKANVKVKEFFKDKLNRVSPIKGNETISQWFEKMTIENKDVERFTYRNIIIWKRVDKIDKGNYVYEIDIF